MTSFSSFSLGLGSSGSCFCSLVHFMPKLAYRQVFALKLRASDVLVDSCSGQIVCCLYVPTAFFCCIRPHCFERLRCSPLDFCPLILPEKAEALIEPLGLSPAVKTESTLLPYTECMYPPGDQFCLGAYEHGFILSDQRLYELSEGDNALHKIILKGYPTAKHFLFESVSICRSASASSLLEASAP